MKENATRKMAPGLDPKNSATGTGKIFRALKWLSNNDLKMASPSQSNSQGNSQAVQGLQAQAGTFIPQPPRLELGDFENLAGKWRAWRQRWNAFAAVSGLNASGG